jgi:hypothetical protein
MFNIFISNTIIQYIQGLCQSGPGTADYALFLVVFATTAVLDTRTVVCLTAAKFKPLVFPVVAMRYSSLRVYIRIPEDAQWLPTREKRPSRRFSLVVVPFRLRKLAHIWFTTWIEKQASGSATSERLLDGCETSWCDPTSGQPSGWCRST